MNSVSSDISVLPQPRIIPNFTIEQELLEHLEKTHPLAYLVALNCINDGRWKLI